jgi:hypothetical protein
MATSTWNFVLWLPDLNETRELIDLPADFYIRVMFRHTMPKEILKPIVTMKLERSVEKEETHTLWEGEPPYYGFAKKVTVTVARNPRDEPPHNPISGQVEIVFQGAPF